MIRILIKKNNIATNQSDFATQELADAWKNEQIQNNSWGYPERWVEETQLGDLDPNTAIETAQVPNPYPREGEPATFTLYKFAAEYEIEQEDVTAEYSRANIKSQIILQEQACEEIMREFKTDNVALLATEATPQAKKTAKTLILSKTKKVLDAVKSGDLDLLIEEIKAIPVQDYDAKYITAARLLSYANMARGYKSLPPVINLTDA